MILKGADVNDPDDNLPLEVDMTDYTREAPRDRDSLQPPRPNAPVPWLYEHQNKSLPVPKGWNSESTESFRKFYPFEPVKKKYQYKHSERRRNYLPYHRPQLPKPLAANSLDIPKCCRQLRNLLVSTGHLPSNLARPSHQNVSSTPFGGLAFSRYQTSEAESSEPMDLCIPSPPIVNTEDEIKKLTAEFRLWSLSNNGQNAQAWKYRRNNEFFAFS